MSATATTTTTTTAANRPAYRDGNVLRWLSAYTASLLGDSVYFVALGFAAAKVAPPAQVGLVMAAGAVPRAVLMLGGGVVADRFGPRLVVIGSDAVRCALILAAAGALALASPGLWLLVAVALLFGVVDALFMPAVGALPPRITTPDQLVRLQGLRALVIRLSTVVGPPAGGLAMGLGGAAAAFTVAGLLFATSVPLLIRTRITPQPRAERAPATQELRDGLRYIRRHRVVGPLVLSGALCELGLVGPLNVGMVLLADERGWGAAGYGWVIAAFSAGAGASALLLTVRGRIPRAGAVQIATLLVGSAAIGFIGVAPVLAVAAGVAFLAGLICGVCGGLASALIQTSTDPAYLGRVTSVMSLTGFGLAPLAYPLFAAAVGAFGPSPVFLASATFAALGAAFTAFLPAIRQAELP
ncbi:MFS transporter [Streptomyces cocklensis]|uniref:MFS-type transporter involved in bile tolerance, Atg22 family n=1 Tax=Actinacidiphila cocklensis TaxID=887465 RepID=A0A9W4E8A3_9ACTN|nr:MFS transporter [Actinacidiphila cocklensis]MDD1060455.1 MFS transporter [Actinacidiphila cocklensis]WSX74008.1 MFS transporter [Streptomyces sp. NBC_00899]WSX79927.1 MFS transporter [Streptomyces sp. NBC_00899]CAG6395354.1 MFS-type transporter involved in bile tolerance, Atg22 family [Actinacidiphila cocklensis]